MQLAACILQLLQENMQLDNKVTPAHVVQLLQGKMHIQGKKVDTELILEEKVHECSDPPDVVGYSPPTRALSFRSL